MKSRHAGRFNHDPDAADYDTDVRNELDPIRAGYDRLLDDVVRELDVRPEHRVLDLGSGTGNLTGRLPRCASILCVDTSAVMMGIARAKLAGRPEVSWMQADLLEVFDAPREPVDRVVSTFAVHHLEADERAALFPAVARVLRPGGRFVAGDLMFADGDARRRLLGGYRAAGRDALVADIEDEFFWDLAADVPALEAAGFTVRAWRVSELAWGVRGDLAGDG